MRIRLGDKLVEFVFKRFEPEFYIDGRSIRWRHKMDDTSLGEVLNKVSDRLKDKPLPKEMQRFIPRDSLLAERQKTHGDFSRNAEVSQSLKYIFEKYGAADLPPEHREALDMIALKISRLLSGQSLYADHWDDIAGYAKLASEACQK